MIDQVIQELATAYRLIDPIIERLSYASDALSERRQPIYEQLLEIRTAIATARNDSERIRMGRDRVTQERRGFTVQEAADYCGMTVPKFKSWVARHGIRCKVPGVNGVYDKQALNSQLDRLVGASGGMSLNEWAKKRMQKELKEEREKEETDLMFARLRAQDDRPTIRRRKKRVI